MILIFILSPGLLKTRHFVCSMSRFDPLVKVSLAGDVIRDCAAKLGKFIDDFHQLTVDVDAEQILKIEILVV